MNKSVKFPGTFRALVAGGLLAVGLGFGEGNYGTLGETSEPGTGIPRDDEGTGGTKGPGMSPTTTTGAAASLPPNVAPGWKIRVCSEKTKAQSINFKVTNADDKSAKADRKDKGAYGAGGSAEGTTAAMTHETASWTQGEANLINLPETIANVEKIKIEATPAQKDAKSEVCVLYNDHVTKKISFDDRSETTVKMTETGSCSC